MARQFVLHNYFLLYVANNRIELLQIININAVELLNRKEERYNI